MRCICTDEQTWKLKQLLWASLLDVLISSEPQTSSCAHWTCSTPNQQTIIWNIQMEKHQRCPIRWLGLLAGQVSGQIGSSLYNTDCTTRHRLAADCIELTESQCESDTHTGAYETWWQRRSSRSSDAAFRQIPHSHLSPCVCCVWPQKQSNCTRKSTSDQEGSWQLGSLDGSVGLLVHRCGPDWNFVQTFMFPTRWTVITFIIGSSANYILDESIGV